MAMASLPTPHPRLLHFTTFPPLNAPRPLLHTVSCHARNLLDAMPHRDGSPDGRSRNPPRTEEGTPSSVGGLRGTAGRTLQREAPRERHYNGRSHWRRGEKSVLEGCVYRKRKEESWGESAKFDEKKAECRGFKQWSKHKSLTARGNMQVQDPKKAGKLGRDDNRARGNSSNKGKKANSSDQGCKLRVGLDMCSKRGDVMGALKLYDSAVKDGICMGQHNYNVLLYLCSSAAIGVVQPAKSGNTSSGIASTGPGYKLALSSNKSLVNMEEDGIAEGHVQDILSVGSSKDGSLKEKTNSIPVSDGLREYARTRGFEIFEKMCSEKDRVPMSEAALTAVARMAMSMGNGDMAFQIVKQMKDLGITPKLRSYGPALTTYCNNGDVEKAFEVETHMLESRVILEEPELEAFLRASVVARRGDKVYYLLHKFRTTVRQVSPSTAKLLEAWFRSSTASKVGKRKWDTGEVVKAIENNGGGWHGLGWFGSGKWNIGHTRVDTNGICVACGEKLAVIDLDPKETEDFALSVVKIANKRERNASFENFQKWLNKHGPFEAVIDAANVGLFSHRHLSLSKVSAVANAIQQKFPSRKWPLIVMHNKHLTGGRMKKPANLKLVEEWKQADSIYSTPTGSNDDWYWLYAAIRCKCLIITNDEMRDHTFQLLENDFFPKWKERHQESEKGHWHIPVSGEDLPEGERTWLCVTRRNSQTSYNDAAT